jgi:hypothetical protein
VLDYQNFGYWIDGILSKFLYSQTDAQVNCLKKDSKIYVKINFKTAPTCFGAVTPSSGSAILMLAKVTVVKIAILAIITLASTVMRSLMMV